MLPLYSSFEHTAQVALLVGMCAFIVEELRAFGYSIYTASEVYCATPSHPTQTLQSYDSLSFLCIYNPQQTVTLNHVYGPLRDKHICAKV